MPVNNPLTVELLPEAIRHTVVHDEVRIPQEARGTELVDRTVHPAVEYNR
jgi:hypothetical protein